MKERERDQWNWFMCILEIRTDNPSLAVKSWMVPLDGRVGIRVQGILVLGIRVIGIQLPYPLDQSFQVKKSCFEMESDIL